MIVSTNDDDVAVDAFAAAMKAKLAEARAKGRGGWQDKIDCSQQALSNMLRAHVEKGDPRDVANFCMFLHQRGETILPTKADAADSGRVDAAMVDRYLAAQKEAIDRLDRKWGTYAGGSNFVREACKAGLEAALAAQGQCEAVAEVYEYPRDHHEPVPRMLTGIRFTGMPLPIGTKLYAAPAAPPAGVPDARIIDLAERLVASGPKAAHVSTSECHEISDFILSLADAQEADRG